MNIKTFTEKQYRKFSKADGNQFITSEYALYTILRLIKKFEPRIILEVGIGIGTLSDTILNANFYFQPDMFGTETDSFCLQQISKNLGDNYKNLKIFRNISELPAEKQFNFIIIDGKEETLMKIVDRVTKRGIIVIEGDRREQVKKLRSLFPKHKFATMVSVQKNSVYSKKKPDEFKGGLKLIFVNPNFFQYMYWVKTKLLMKFKYFKRDYLT